MTRIDSFSLFVNRWEWSYLSRWETLRVLTCKISIIKENIKEEKRLNNLTLRARRGGVRRKVICWQILRKAPFIISFLGSAYFRIVMKCMKIGLQKTISILRLIKIWGWLNGIISKAEDGCNRILNTCSLM